MARFKQATTSAKTGGVKISALDPRQDMSIRLAPGVAGFVAGLVAPMLGLRSGQAAVNYYAEVHTQPLNSKIHAIFMPLVMLGMFLWIPAMLHLQKFASEMRVFTIFFYFGLYLPIDPGVAMTFAMIHLGMFVIAQLYNPKYTIRHGLFLSLTALVIQELFGHFLSGDPASRLEAIPNAIGFAPFFASAHL